jgi:myo-inositol-1(or 4)-monophosphatase
LKRALEVAVAAAEAAGQVLRDSFGQRLDVEYKEEAELVTEADEKAEQKIKHVLVDAFPSYGMLTEESEEVAGEGVCRWIVDPLDGTTNYAHGLPIFAVSAGKATDYQGGKLDLEGREVVASHGLLHPALTSITSKYAP